MRVSVQIEEDIVQHLMELTGATTRSAAIAKGASEFVRRQKAKEFGRLIREGAFDYPEASAEEVSWADPIPPLMED